MGQRYYFTVALLLCGCFTFASDAENYSLDNQFISRHAYQPGVWLQHLLQLDSELEFDIASDSTAVVRTRAKTDFNGYISKDKTALELREAYFSREAGDYSIKIGKQYMAWSEMDGLSGLEVVSPRSFREFILQPFHDTAMGQWMFNLSKQQADGFWQVVLIDSKTHQLPETGDWYEFRARRLRYGFEYTENPTFQRLQTEAENPSLAGRWRQYRQGWEWGLQLRIGPDFEPVGDIVEEQRALKLFYPEHLRLGASASAQLDEVVLRGEVALSPKRTFNFNQNGILSHGQAQQLSLAMGLDWNAPFNTFINVQVLWDRVQDPKGTLVRPATDLLWSLSLSRDFQQDTVQAQARWYGSRQSDGLLRLHVAKNLDDLWTLKLGVDLFYGNNDGYFGQYAEHDRSFLEISSHF